jgi:hypothetical protein
MAAGSAGDSSLPQPEDAAEQSSLAWRELERMFAYFDRGASRNRLGYLVLRTVVLVAGAVVPIMALAADSPTAVACIGAVIVLAEGFTQLTQVHGHWVRYRRTAEALRREALTFVSRTGAYRQGDLDRTQLLASRLLDVASQESTGWEETVRAGLAKPSQAKTA